VRIVGSRNARHAWSIAASAASSVIPRRRRPGVTGGFVAAGLPAVAAVVGVVVGVMTTVPW